MHLVHEVPPFFPISGEGVLCAQGSVILTRPLLRLTIYDPVQLAECPVGSVVYQIRVGNGDPRVMPDQDNALVARKQYSFSHSRQVHRHPWAFFEADPKLYYYSKTSHVQYW